MTRHWVWVMFHKGQQWGGVKKITKQKETEGQRWLVWKETKAQNCRLETERDMCNGKKKFKHWKTTVTTAATLTK